MFSVTMKNSLGGTAIATVAWLCAVGLAVPANAQETREEEPHDIPETYPTGV